MQTAINLLRFGPILIENRFKCFLLSARETDVSPVLWSIFNKQELKALLALVLLEKACNYLRLFSFDLILTRKGNLHNILGNFIMLSLLGHMFENKHIRVDIMVKMVKKFNFRDYFYLSSSFSRKEYCKKQNVYYVPVAYD